MQLPLSSDNAGRDSDLSGQDPRNADARKVYENEALVVEDWEGRVFENLELRNCQLNKAGLSLGTGLDTRSTVRNVTAVDCEMPDGRFSDVIFDTVDVNGLRKHPRSLGIQLPGCAFRRVTLAGKIGEIGIGRSLTSPISYADEIDRWNAEYHASEEVDWMLNIKDAIFTGYVSLASYPGDKIIRNPESQVLVSRERAQQRAIKPVDGGTGFDHYDFGETGFEFALMDLIDPTESHGPENIVLVAPTQGPLSAMSMRAIDVLRTSGLAVPEEEIPPIRVAQ